MNRRIARAILGVTAFAVVAFALPLAYAVDRLYHDEEIVRLERIATSASGEVSTGTVDGQDRIDLPATHDQIRVAVYTPLGIRLTGAGPSSDPRVQAARRGQVAVGAVAGEEVVAVPVTRDEAVTAIIRVGIPDAVVSARVHRTWLLMLGIGLGVVGLAAVLAALEARRLARPVNRLTEATTRLGDGDFTVTVEPSGVAELDRAASAVEATARRLGGLLARERAFSADASHQLRTPVTALRLQLESALTEAGPVDVDVLHGSLDAVGRLETTIDDLLELARDTQPSNEPVHLTPVLTDLAHEWRGRLRADGRPLQLELGMDHDPVLRIHEAALRQVLAVLLSNARQHGRGRVTLRVRTMPGAVGIDVEDEGSLPDGQTQQLFERRSAEAVGTGIGLALARSIAEADGARLVARSGATTRFTLLVTTSGPERA